MASATAATHPPVAKLEHLDRLAVLPEERTPAAVRWDDVHNEVQAELALLEAKVRRKIPDIRVDAGRTHGKQFLLFSYRTFSMPDSEVDPVVAGITFTSAEQDVMVDADFSGEQTGDSISTLPSKTVANSSDEVLEAARDSARMLCESADALAAAIIDPSRNVE
jgi:hypothetical protein